MVGKKEQLIKIFGTSLGVCFYVFSLCSFPLAVYGLSKILALSIIFSILITMLLLFVVPLGELVTLGLAVYGLIKFLK